MIMKNIKLSGTDEEYEDSVARYFADCDKAMNGKSPTVYTTLFHGLLHLNSQFHPELIKRRLLDLKERVSKKTALPGTV